MRANSVNILLVDDQPAKLMSYEVILQGLGENLIKASSAREAFEHLLRTDIAVILVDVCMPDLDGFELASMIREHPRFQQTSIIFVSAVMMDDPDRLRGYEVGAVDYVPVPVVPELLRAKVRVFAELHRKTRELERLNSELERRVTERTAQLEASNARLKESEQRRSLALAAGRMGSWDWDLQSGVCHWDEGQCQIYGVAASSEPFSQEEMLAFVHPDDRRELVRLATRAAQAGEPFSTEFRIRRADGQMRWCGLGAAPSSANGETLRISGVTHDMTARKEMEAVLHRTNAELEQRVEERTRERELALAQLFEAQKLDTIGQLTGGVAHDFNNLLMAILSSLELVRTRMPPDERLLRLVDNAMKGAERGSALTQRLLAFARRQELKPQAVDLAEIGTGMSDLLARTLGPSIQISFNIPDHLPPVEVDPNQFELALLNLAINARDAMPAGGSISISAHHEQTVQSSGLPPGDYVRISVRDTGSGMDEETLARATEPFFTTKGTGKGTGLGLSMVHGLAAQSGGLLRLTSRIGRGTIADLWLRRALAGHEPARALAPSGRTAPATSSRLVLVVDDDALVSSGTVAMLEHLGHSVLEAASGAAALELLQCRPEVEVLLTDFAMPEMTGLELASRIRDTSPDLPIILATGFAELPPSAASDLAIGRLMKPFNLHDLEVALAQVLGAEYQPLQKLRSSY